MPASSVLTAIGPTRARARRHPRGWRGSPPSGAPVSSRCLPPARDLRFDPILATLGPMLPPENLVPHPSAEEDEPRRLGRRWRIVGVVGAVLVAVVVAAALIPVPYVALRPGSVWPVNNQITVVDADSFPSDQPVAFTTVSSRSASVLEAAVGWLDKDIDVLPKEAVRGKLSAGANRRYNAELMETSISTAIAVAEGYLGEDVRITTSGVIVREISPDSSAAAVLERNDVIVTVDDEPVDEIGELGTLLQVGGPGASHTLGVERPAGSTTRIKVQVTTAAAEDRPERAVIGIIPQDRIVDFDFPIDVTIDSGTVGGPSAGLAFTLAVIDTLTPGQLTGGTRVAVTGTIALDGTVGPVGGGVQKAVAVRQAGYDVFLVPTSEFELVRAAVGDDVQVIAVDTLEEALAALIELGGTPAELVPQAAGGGGG